MGSLKGLTDTAVEWANDDTIELHAFLLSGIALIVADPEAREGASVAMPALRARTQAPVPFKAYLTKRIEDVVKVDEMHRLLAAELHYETGYTPDATAVVESAFRATVDREKLKAAADRVKVMHPGPMNRGVEIDSDVADDPEISLIQDQVEMGVAARMAVLAALSARLDNDR